MFDTRVSAALPPPASPPALPSGAGDAAARKEKARRRTATPEELLFSGGGSKAAPSPLLPVLETPEEERAGRLPGAGDPMGGGDRDTSLMPPPKAPLAPRKTSSLPRMTVTAPSASGPGPSPSLRRKEYVQPSPDPSPTMRRKTMLVSDRLTRSSSLEMTVPPEATPPGSPTMSRRSQRSSDENVFSRLTNMQSNSPTPNRGLIQPMSRPTSARGFPLACMHVAEGHSKAVLSVCASDHLLFTGSKDRTAKGWDLSTGKEIMNFADHPNNVVKVKYVESNHMVFTVSQSFIKVWDVRLKTANCIKTLSSSGLTVDGDLGESKSRQCELSPGEHYIYDIIPSYDGQALYCATGSMVRIWDIRRFHSMGKLSSGTNAAVMVLALDWHNGTNMVIAGSKDHYIKVYEVIVDAAGVISPKYNLTPPHYDGVQSLAVMNRMLFSGSRDMGIKKWDLETQTLKQQVNAAHKDWVCALDFMPGRDLLVSGCRAGFLKLWNLEDCSPAGEIRAHSSHINAIATNSTSVFTASNDATVGLWQAKTGSENSDSSSDVGDDRLSVSSN